MIKVEELRIGNYTDKGIIKNFYENGIHVGLGKCYGYNVINPIPLTEEILLKFGADKHEDTSLSELKCFKIGKYLWFTNGWFCKITDDSGNFNILNENVFYLHQLQNLYFALTGEELKINL